MRDGWGFGYTRDEKGTLHRKPNNYGLVCRKGVDIGVGTVIDKGSYRDTFIDEGTKIDNLCHIAHNVRVGKHCLIVSGTVLGGSSEVGDYSYIGMNVCIRQHTKIGKHCIVGAGSVVINDIPDYDIIAGNPAVSIKNKVNLSDKQRYDMVGY